MGSIGYEEVVDEDAAFHSSSGSVCIPSDGEGAQTVPPRPVTPDMEDGVYGSYELEKTGNTMHITSIE